jgi:hypothetical protein
MLVKLIVAQIQQCHAAAAAQGSSVQGLQAWQAAVLQLPLLQQVVFSTNRKTKTWAAAALSQLKQVKHSSSSDGNSSSSSSSSRGMAVLAEQGPLATLAAVSQLLQMWWTDSSSSSSSVMPVLSWLSCLSESLEQIGHDGSSSSAAAAGSKRSSATALTVPLPSASAVRELEDDSAGDTAGVVLSVGGLAWFSSHGLNPAVQLLLAALLQHPNADVAVAAAGLLQQLVLLLPQLAPSFLPLVLQQLRAAYAAADAAGVSESSRQGSSRVAAALLQLLPAMCYDSSTAALVWRMLQPLMAAAKPDQALHIKQQHNAHGQYSSTAGLTRSLAVQVAVAAWNLTGRGWTRVEAAVNGCIKPHEGLGAGYGAQGLGLGLGREPLELRLLRATAMRYIADHLVLEACTVVAGLGKKYCHVLHRLGCWCIVLISRNRFSCCNHACLGCDPCKGSMQKGQQTAQQANLPVVCCFCCCCCCRDAVARSPSRGLELLGSLTACLQVRRLLLLLLQCSICWSLTCASVGIASHIYTVVAQEVIYSK